MRRPFIDLFCFVVIEMVELLVMGGLLCRSPQYFKSCLIHTVVSVEGVSLVFVLLLCEVYLRCFG
jgi:hypothetical protein